MGYTALVTMQMYQYSKCGTCRKARKWLDEHGVAYQSIDIVEEPPSRAVLEKAWRRAGVPINKLFNTSGQSYRQGGFKDKLATMTEAQALDALAADGKLIKRPLALGDGFVLIGFRDSEWQEALL